MNRKHGTSMPFKAVQVPTGNTPEDAAARPDYCLPHQDPVAAFEFPSGGSLGWLWVYLFSGEFLSAGVQFRTATVAMSAVDFSELLASCATPMGSWAVAFL
jgi:hypothetical protein